MAKSYVFLFIGQEKLELSQEKVRKCYRPSKFPGGDKTCWVEQIKVTYYHKKALKHVIQLTFCHFIFKNVLFESIVRQNELI